MFTRVLTLLLCAMFAISAYAGSAFTRDFTLTDAEESFEESPGPKIPFLFFPVTIFKIDLPASEIIITSFSFFKVQIVIKHYPFLTNDLPPPQLS